VWWDKWTRPILELRNSDFGVPSCSVLSKYCLISPIQSKPLVTFGPGIFMFVSSISPKGLVNAPIYNQFSAQRNSRPGTSIFSFFSWSVCCRRNCHPVVVQSLGYLPNAQMQNPPCRFPKYAYLRATPFTRFRKICQL